MSLNRAFTVLPLLFLLSQPYSDLHAEESRTEMTFCLPSVDCITQNKNANFNVVLNFSISGAGQPEDIQAVLGFDGVSIDEAIECVEQWRFEKFPDRQARAILYWEHGYGWKHLIFASDSLVMKMNLPLDQYRVPNYQEKCRE